MSFPYGPTTFDALTTGAAILAGDWGAQSKQGSGTSTVVLPGLFGSAKCAELATAPGQHIYYRQDVTGHDLIEVLFDFQADAPGDGTTTVIRCRDASDNDMAEVRFTSKGILKMLRDAGEVVGDSDFRYLGSPDDESGPTPGAEYHLMYRIQQSVGRQSIWVYRSGHFMQMAGADRIVGPNPITRLEVGSINEIDGVIRLDNVFVTGTAQPIPEEIGIASQWNGAPTTDGVKILVNGQGYTAVRGTIFEVNGLDSVLQTDTYELPKTRQRATMAIRSLPVRGGEYEYTLEGQRNDPETGDSTWEAAGIRGKFRTLPEKGKPWSGRIAGLSCLLNKLPSIQPEKTAIWLRANPPDFITYGGDLFYDNLKDLSAGPFRGALETQLEKHPEFTALLAETTTLDPRSSDHDWGGGNDADTQHPATEFGNIAWLDSVPHWDTWHPASEAETDPQNFTKSVSGDLGRWHIIAPDFRWLGRSDATDPDTEAKICYHPDDTARIIAEIDNPAYAAILYISDPPWVGTADELAGKGDHVGRYPNNRAPINAAIARRLARGQVFLGWAFDYHGMALREMGLTIDDTGGGAAWLTGGGMSNNTGNIRPDDWPNYEQIFGAAEADPDDDYDIWCHTEWLLTDDGLTMTARGIGRDNDAEAIVIDSGIMTWTVPYTAPPLAPPSWDIGSLQCTDPYGRWAPLRATQPPDVPSKSASIVKQPFADGRTISTVYTDAGVVSVVLKVYDLDLAGLPGGRVQRDLNIDAITSQIALKVEQEFGFRPEWTGPVTRSYRGYVLASAAVRRMSPGYAEVTILGNLLGAARSTIQTVWGLDLTDGAVFRESILPLLGSTAPTTEYWFRMSGGFQSFKVLDVATDRWVRIVAPDDPVEADQAVVVDAMSWKAWLIDDADGWDTSDGVDVSTWIKSTQIGGPVLALEQRSYDGNVDVREVKISVNVGTPVGSPQFSIKCPAGAWA